MELSKKIKEIREDNNLSLKNFAKLIDVSDVAVLKWEQGKTEPKASNLKALANIFNFDLNDFLEINTSEKKVKQEHTPAQKELINECKDLTDKEITRVLGYVQALKNDKYIRKIINEG